MRPHLCIAICILAACSRASGDQHQVALASSGTLYQLGYTDGSTRSAVLAQLGQWTVGQVQELALAITADHGLKIDGIELTPTSLSGRALLAEPATTTLQTLWQKHAVTTALSQAAFTSGFDSLMRRRIGQGRGLQLTAVDYAVQANLLAAIAQALLKDAGAGDALGLDAAATLNYKVSYDRVMMAMTQHRGCKGGYQSGQLPSPKALPSLPGYTAANFQDNYVGDAYQFHYDAAGNDPARTVTMIDTQAAATPTWGVFCNLGSMPGGVQVKLFSANTDPHGHRAIIATSPPDPDSGSPADVSLAASMQAFHEAVYGLPVASPAPSPGAAPENKPND